MKETRFFWDFENYMLQPSSRVYSSRSSSSHLISKMRSQRISRIFTVGKDLPYPMTYQVDVEVTDISNLSVADSQTFTALTSQKLIGYIYASKRFQNYILYCKLKVWVSAIQLDNFFFNINWWNKVKFINHSYAQYLHIKKCALPFFVDFNYYIANMCTLVR